MRAEERRGRALIDLEREDARRADQARRETKEAFDMHQEDLAARELIRQEMARSVERQAMHSEETLSKAREIFDR